MKRFAGPIALIVSFLFFGRWFPSQRICPEIAGAYSASEAGLPDASLAGVGSAVAARPDSIVPDPFALAPIPEAAPSSAIARPSGPAPSRPWTVTGLVGARAAVLMKPDGSSTVVSVGQRIDSAVVVGISADGVELEDRGGRILLKVR